VTAGRGGGAEPSCGAPDRVARSGRPPAASARSRGARALAAVAAVALGGTIAAACGSSASLGQLACRDVRQSIATYESSLHDHGARRSAAQAAAERQLRAALAPAAQAASGNGMFQALMTTISESPAVPEGYLVQALRAQCAYDTGGSGTSGGTGTTGGATGGSGQPGGSTGASG
jgi:outer membrane murein-binding lipoprotein Lpp